MKKSIEPKTSVNAVPPECIQIFANPAAGNFRIAELKELVRSLEVAGKRVILSTELPFRVAEEGVDQVIVLGGDGTVRNAVAAVIETGRPIPVVLAAGGTINLVARELADGQGGGMLCHVAQVNGRVMTACLSVGPDAWIVANASPGLKRKIGRFAYVAAAVRQMLCWRRERFRVMANGRWIDCAALYVAKGHYYAGPWSFAPEAALTDTRLHGVALLSGRRRDYIAFVWALARGRVEQCRSVIRFVCDHLEIDGEGASPVQVDGDHVATLPVRVEIHPMAINIALLERQKARK